MLPGAIGLHVPNIGVPVSGASDYPVGLRTPIDASNTEVVLIQSRAMCPLVPGERVDLPPTTTKNKELSMQFMFSVDAHHQTHATCTSLLFLEMATCSPLLLKAWHVTGATLPSNEYVAPDPVILTVKRWY